MRLFAASFNSLPFSSSRHQDESIMKTTIATIASMFIVASGWTAAATLHSVEPGFDSTADAVRQIAAMKIKPGDWPQWGGTASRNNTPLGKGIAIAWDVA